MTSERIIAARTRVRRRHGLSRALAAAGAALAITFASSPSSAVEGGASFYLLGGKIPGSGLVPPTGVYFQNDVYLYQGDIGADIELPIGGDIVAGVEASLVFEAPTILGVTPWPVLGGRLGFGLTVPVGYSDITASLGPFSVEDDVFTIGDPIAAALLGWDAGNFHWSLGALVNIPVGDYQEGELANVALHRWGADVTGGITWLDPELGLDLSVAAGVTFNGENEATDYNSGNEFHLEASASKYLTEAFELGIGGYYNHQISDDSGAGDVLGANRGEVIAVGAFATYTFEAGTRPVTAKLRYFHEMEAERRLEGDVIFFTLAMPLWVKPPPAE
jgi:hypothetical protein